ncbi:MAG: MarR family winged helix-turn-helix transcriptional regulator [Woeseiaceae bacterium]|nr:MarR family winged helix-turn-helix transcriptional regulator [Woeseiaceae bacterium]
MDNRFQTALVALRRILRVTEISARRLADQSELTASQLLVLQHLGQVGKALPSAIARTVDLKQATVTVLVNKLEASGLVTRRRDTEDRRRVWVELTEAGQAALNRSPDLLQHRFEEGFARLDEWEQAMIIATLERVAALLDAEQLEAAPILDVGDLDRIVMEETENLDARNKS